jgi:hypothetical protein
LIEAARGGHFNLTDHGSKHRQNTNRGQKWITVDVEELNAMRSLPAKEDMPALLDENTQYLSTN